MADEPKNCNKYVVVSRFSCQILLSSDKKVCCNQYVRQAIAKGADADNLAIVPGVVYQRYWSFFGVG